MANKNLFKTSTAPNIPAATTTNAAGGKAYDMTAKHALAQLAATNCFNSTYYASADNNLQLAKDTVAKLKNDPEFIAKVAVYSRSKAYLKDMPAYLVAVLATIDAKLFRKVFPKVIDNGKMLRNFIQIARSGQAGKVINLSSGAVRNALDQWFKSRSCENLFRASIGNDPNFRDILRMARPRPETDEKAALYAYLKGAEYDKKERTFVTRNKEGGVLYSHSFDALPSIVRQFEAFKLDHKGEIPNVDFRMLDSVLTKEEARGLWAKQAENAAWTMTRMNLNNFAKYGAFEDKKLIAEVARRLRDREAIVKARAFPYQLLMAYKATEINATVPPEVKLALQDAMEIATENTPDFGGKVYVCVDTSGSMSSPVTGSRGTVSTSVSCVDVAGLFAACVLRQNPTAEVVPFDTAVRKVQLNPRDSIVTNAQKLALRGGGTDCGCALRHLNAVSAKGDAVIFVSDNESWVDGGNYRGTGLLTEWATFKKRNKNARLVCIDLTPRTNSQVVEHQDILQVGGFSDTVFDVVNNFIRHGSSSNHWVAEIEAIDLDAQRESRKTPVDTEPVAE